MPPPYGTDDGVAQLGAPDLQKGELLKLLSALPHRHLSSPMLRHKLTLKEGDLPDKVFDIIVSRG
jgi:hypothetical protein